MSLPPSKDIPEGVASPDSVHQFYSAMPPTNSTRRVSAHELQTISDNSPGEIDARQPSWRDLFNFTTQSQIPRLIFTIFITIASACIQPVAAIIYGKIFTILALFGSGGLSGTDTLREISKYCLVLFILGLSAWFVELFFMGLWTTFGELQAQAIRQQIFASMLEKDMYWYDMRQDGIDSLLVRIET